MVGRRLVSFALAAAVASSALLAGDVLADSRSAPIPAAKRVKVVIDRTKVNLPGHTLEAQMSRPADKIHLKVTGDSGAILAELDIPFNGAPAGTPLTCNWTPSSDEAVARVDVVAYAPDGYWAGIAITPWKAEIPHEEVNFAVDSDAVQAAEAPKLEASLRAIQAVVAKQSDRQGITLYIVGHTDTVGTAEHNVALSRRRARSIGGWFRQHGAKVAIAYEGFGEAAPLVPTADEVDEPKNRRVDYVVSVDPPALPDVSLGWHAL